jgi:phosphoribosylformimino-5-aminoimidazole carboxamide ribotide isomerase
VKLFPAIDLLGGRAVRLEEGKRERATVFHDRPIELVAELAQGGADRLHVVDLDGAFGEPRQLTLIAAIVAASPIPVEVGGGIRDRDALERVIALGAAFVVLGTAAVRSPALVEHACRAYPNRIIVAVDARDGIVAVDGWTASGGISAVQLGTRAAGWGAAALLYTDVARDGMLQGLNLDATIALAEAISIPVIASGGLASLEDVRALMQPRAHKLAGAIAGRALYDGRLDPTQALQLIRSGRAGS